MANKTVIIATIKDSEKWINISDNEGVEYGIYKEKCQTFRGKILK